MAKWKLPENRKPITAMESADLVLRMHKKLVAGFTAGDRISQLEELYEAAKQDANEAEAYAGELEAVFESVKAKLAESEARLAKAVVNLRTYAPCLVDGPEHDVGYYYGYHTALNRILDTLAELKGETDE